MIESIQKGSDIKDISWAKHVRPEWDENNEEMERIWSRIFKAGARNIMMAFIVLLVMAFTAGASGNGTNETLNATATGTAAPTATVTEGTGTVSDSEEELLDDINEYDGSIGPGNSLYGLKLAFERLDETFTFNESEKLGKQVAHARQRIAEMRSELKKKNNEAANRALEKHREKIKEIDRAVSEVSDLDEELLHAQKMIAKHQAVLKELVDSHPNNTGLARAYNNSLELKEKFESRTGKEYAIVANKGKKVLREIEIDGTKEKLKIKAEVTGNITKIKVDVRFASNATDNFTIAQEILNRLKLNAENINSIMEVEEEDEEDDRLKEKLEAEAVVRGNVSKVEFEYRFPLNVTNRSEIAEEIYQKLFALTPDDILDVLEIKIKKEMLTEIKQKEKRLEKKVKEELEEKEDKLDKKVEEVKKREEKVKEEIEEKLKKKERNQGDKSGRED